MKKLSEVELLFRENFHSMYKTAHYIVKDKQMAKDVVQDVFFQFWKSREKIEIGPEIKGYLFKATVSFSLNHLKKKQKETKLGAELTNLKASVSYSPFQSMVSKDLKGEIDNAIMKLPPKCQSVFMMSRYGGMKHQDIANTMGISIKTVENQISIALKKLKYDLAPYLGIEFSAGIFALVTFSFFL